MSSNDFKTGMSIEMDGQPYKVVGTILPYLKFRNNVVHQNDTYA